MKMKHFLVIALLASMVVLGIVENSEAVCQLQGRIIYSYTNGTVLYVFIAPSSAALPTYYVYYTTTDPELMQKLNTAQAGNLRCTIRGSADVCPTTGPQRFGGVVQLVYTY